MRATVDDGIVTASECRNCGAPRTTQFCGACGQPAIAGRFTMKRLLHLLVAGALDLDRGLLHTFIELLRRPGRVARAYIGGQTMPYTNPVQYFFLAVTIAQVAALWTGAVDEVIDGFISGVSAEQAGPVQPAHGPLVEFVSAYSVALAAPAVVFMAAFTRALFRRSGRNYAETLVFSLFTGSQIFLGLALAMPLLNGAKLVAVLVIAAAIPATIAYCASAAAHFFEPPPAGVAIRVVTAMTLAAVSYLLFTSLLLAVAGMAAR